MINKVAQFVALVLFLGASPLFAKVDVVTSLPTLAAVAKEIGGEKVNVTSMAKPNQDPHYIDPRPNLVLLLNRADLLIVNGLELEESWLNPLLVNARNPKVSQGQAGYLDASTAITHKLEIPLGQIDRSQGDIHAGGNPHYLFAPTALIQIAGAVSKRLSQLDADNSLYYKNNLDKLKATIEALQSTQQQKFSALSPEKRQVVSYHQSLSYVYKFLGLTQVATIEPRPGIAPSPSRVATVLSTMKQQGATAIIQESYYPTNISETLVKLSGGKLAVIPGGVNFEGNQSVEQHLQMICDTIYEAVQ